MTRLTRSSVSATSSSSKKFDVFEFNDEDARVQKISQKILGKFRNPKKDRKSPIDKYKFLEVFAGSSKALNKDISSDPIDVDAEDACEDDQEIKFSPEETSNKQLEANDSEMNHQCTDPNLCSMDASLQDYVVKEEISGTDGFLKGNSHFGNESLDMVSDEDDQSELSSLTSSLIPAEVDVSLKYQRMEHGSAAFEIVIDGSKMVNVFPDFTLYGGDLYSTRSRLIFSRISIKLEGSTVKGNGGTFNSEWAIEDLIKIESYWFGKVETAMINLFLKSKNSREVGNATQNPGIKQLKFAVYDPCWSNAEEAIKTLDEKYADAWNAVLDIDADSTESISTMRQNNFFSPTHYFPNFDETFEEVIYPKGDADAVSIGKRDVELLQPETFINDTIIDFYIKYLKNKIPPVEQHRFHFFNSFFFRKLADLDKDPSSGSDGRAAFQRVRKWTRKVNLFEKDYIFIPINYSLHWSLIVICHPGEITCFKDQESTKVPCILHMDSLKGSHRGLKNVLQSYLCEEWKERHSDMMDDIASKFFHLRFVSLELPQQENLYDCGLFLLHYAERFLEEAPIEFSLFRITKLSNFLTRNWFPPAEASLKRAYIQKLIYDIIEDNSQKAPRTECVDKGFPSGVPGIFKHKTEADSLEGRCHPTMRHCHGNPSSSTVELEADILLPTASSIRVTSYLLEGASNLAPVTCQQRAVGHQRGFMSPIQEIEETDEETDVSPLLIENSHQVAVLALDFPSTSCISKDFEASETLQQEFSLNLGEPVKGSSCSEIPASGFWNTMETGAPENRPLEEIEPDLPDKANNLEYSSTFIEELANCVVQDSEEDNDGHDFDSSMRSASSLEGNLDSVPHQNSDLAQSFNLEDDTSVSKRESLLLSESDERDAKRPKLKHAGSERRFTRSLLKETCLMSL